MRIAILTLPLHFNYGGILQNYALQQVLIGMGHDVKTLDRGYPPRIPIRLRLRQIKEYFLKRLKGQEHNRLHFVLFYYSELRKESTYTRAFVERYINLYHVNSYQNVKEGDFDAFIVGSDQIWRPKYFYQIGTAYLNFTKDWEVKRIAYAPSFGTNDWEYTPEQTSACGSFLRSFDAVSVRERKAVDLCKEHFSVDAQWVLDPTMLLNSDDYVEKFEITEQPQSKGDMLVYVLNENDSLSAAIKDISTQKGYTPFRVNSKCEDRRLPISERIQPPVEQWLRGFYDCKFVVTDSFHACVFSILFNKPFIVFGNVKRGMERFSSLLSMFGLEDRLVSNSEQALEVSSQDIDWASVNNALDQQRGKSMQFLADALR